MAEKEQQIKVLKTDVLEKERKITGEKKAVELISTLSAVSVIHTYASGVKCTIKPLSVLYQVLRKRSEEARRADP